MPNEPESLAAVIERMKQASETPEERAARKAIEKRARELKMSVESLAWLMALEEKCATLLALLKETEAHQDKLEQRIEALEQGKPRLYLP